MLVLSRPVATGLALFNFFVAMIGLFLAEYITPPRDHVLLNPAKP
ncbi:MAG: hypothetical protein P0121_03490 [Nitrospira sp.]|nr:hypothetical protein [Nitrospira sp.]